MSGSAEGAAGEVRVGPVGQSLTGYGGPLVDGVAWPGVEEWLVLRPAPQARAGAAIRSTVTAITQLVRCGDDRCAALGKGAVQAVRWVGGHDGIAPVSGRWISDPCLIEIAQEVEAAGRAAAGADDFQGVWSDEGRMAARGVEEWLAWVVTPAYPTPAWLTPGTDLATIRAGLGDVGREGPGWPGLLGEVSGRGWFAYEVADHIDAIKTARTPR